MAGLGLTGRLYNFVRFISRLAISGRFRLFVRRSFAQALFFVLGFFGEFFLTLLKCIVWRDQLAFLSERGEIVDELTMDRA